jgi:hypothetical protein
VSIEQVVATYAAAWDEPGREKRKALLEASITADAVYVDPTVETRGIPALMDHIDTVAARYPGSCLQLTSAVDVHHGLGRFGWRKVLADGTELPECIDIVELADDGKLARVIGFFGPLRPRTGP